MARTSTKLAALAAILTLSLSAACGPSQEEQLAAARADGLKALEDAKAALDAKRQELAQLRQELADLEDAAESAEEAAEGEEVDAEARAAELESSIAQLQEETAAEADELTSAIVEFINQDPPIEGEPLSETQQAAIRLKSAEDMLVAREHIQKGGDYRRAIDIYQQALLVDPENEDLQAALEEAEANRYMTEERFAQVRKGMSESDVRETLGTPFYRNIREYPDRGVIAWFYATNEDGAAAAVWFRGEEGEREVYQTKFDAVSRGEQPE